MKFCYLDESGKGHESLLVLAGIVVDAQRMHLAKREYQALFQAASNSARSPIPELHARDLLPGNDKWRRIDPSIRKGVVSDILEWISCRSHKIVFAAVDRKRFVTTLNDFQYAPSIPDDFTAAAFHIMLSLQRHFQQLKRNKGKIVFVFDQGANFDPLYEIVIDPPPWSRAYYEHAKKPQPLSQIVDMPFTADSKLVPLIQVADLICYIIRTYTLISDYERSEKYQGELDDYTEWVKIIKSCLVPQSHRYKKKSACELSKFYNELAPPSLYNL